jgi:hypothetical protein
MTRLFERFHLYAGQLLAAFLLGLLALNWGRWDEWDGAGFTLYLTQPIMQTTLYDFAFVLFIVLTVIRQDARHHRLAYTWIVAFFPFMPTIGLLMYMALRNRALRNRGVVPPPLAMTAESKPLHG